MIKIRKWLCENMTLVMAGAIGAFVFILLYGVKVLNPCYTDWLMSGGDLSQHYLGWKMYRNGDWTFPIGLTDQLAYPYYTSVIFTDSIPIFAVFFKLLSPILPANFVLYFSGNTVREDFTKIFEGSPIGALGSGLFYFKSHLHSKNVWPYSFSGPVVDFISNLYNCIL